MESKSSKLSASSEKKLATAELQNNGSYTDPMRLRKSKRFKVAAASHFSSDSCIRSRTVLKKVPDETRENKNVVSGGCVPFPGAKVELLPGDHLESFDEKLFGVAEGDESHPVNILIQEQNRSELDMTEAVEVEPVSICWEEEVDEVFASASKDVVMGSVCREGTVGTKQLRGRSITIVRDCSPYTGSMFSKRGKTMEVAISMEEKKSDCGDNLGQSLAESISPEEVLEPLELDKSKIKAPKPVESADRRNTRKGKANVELPPSRPSGSSKGDSARSKVKETLRLFYGACRKILQEEEARPRETKGGMFRVAAEASKIIKSQGKYLNVGTRIVGSVPGVEVGDEFQYRIELNFLGIHRPSQAGIDYMIDACGDKVATSIVSSGGYDDDLDNSDVLTYTGQGGNVINKGNKNSEPKDQELVKGNLALANSKDKKNPVRVIRGNKATPLGSSADAKNYVYDGLYLVEEFWQETGSHGKMVFKFRLRRIPGQPELTWKVLKKITKTSKSREGLCDSDISKGKERFPICAVNELDDEKPPLFTYTVDMIYPDWCKPIPPKGCGCMNRCSESKSCACVAKNGGELPYNHDGAIVNAKPLVYECGPLCKCPPSCYLRATQRGIKFQLEIFKTESRGWGVRSLNSIPCGSFICEYTGELLEENEAERLAGNDEYLFDVGKDHEMGGFTIDAARKGNIGRFINHSCSPNLYAQDVLYDHDETRISHVMFFAQDNIPPLVELSYSYNYTIDQVRDSDGNIRKKNCYCGSSECTGRMY